MSLTEEYIPGDINEFFSNEEIEGLPDEEELEAVNDDWEEFVRDYDFDYKDEYGTDETGGLSDFDLGDTVFGPVDYESAVSEFESDTDDSSGFYQGRYPDDIDYEDPVDRRHLIEEGETAGTWGR